MSGLDPEQIDAVSRRYAQLSPDRRLQFRLRVRDQGLEARTLRIVPLCDSDPARPLSHAQERLWFLWRLEPGSSSYNITKAVRIRGALDTATLRSALTGLVLRHGSMRTRFSEVDGVAVQVADESPVYSWVEHDLSDLDVGSREERLTQVLRDHATAPFDLVKGPVLRAGLVRLAESEHVLMLAMHHIVSDGWSMEVLVREFGALYAAGVEGREADLPELPIQYGDYALWQREWLDDEALAAQLGYWRERLGEEHPVLALPVDRVRTGARAGTGSRVQRTISKELTERLTTLSHEHGATLFMTLLAAWQLLLHRYSGQSQIRVGVPVAGRNRVETQALVGFFVNTLVLRGDLHGAMTVSEMIEQARGRMIEAQANQDLPFAKLVEALQPERSLSTSPLFQTAFAYNQSNASHSANDPNARIEEIRTGNSEVRFDLAVVATAFQDALVLGLNYTKDIFDAVTIEHLFDHYIELLEQIAVVAGDTALGALCLSSSAPHAEPASYSFRTVWSHIAARVAEDPSREALSCDGERLSYEDLAALSGRIGRQVAAVGAGADDRVGLCVRRSPAMVAALLGVLRSGAAFVPLDPDYPEERLAAMLADSGIRVVVADRESAARLDAVLGDVVVVLVDGEAAEAVEDTPIEAEVHPDQLAYVIYTSGSTGTPKGVAISHGSLNLHLEDFLATYGITASDRVLHSSTINFDVALHEVLPALMRGGRVVMRGTEPWTLETLTATLEREAVTFSRIPTALWQQWLAALPAALPALRQVTVGGEGLPGDALGRWQAGPLAHVPVDNLYGPTETTVAATYRRTEASDAAAAIVSIGVPYPGRTAYVLDADGNIAPVGGLGELCIGGASVARGYLDRPALTAERFVPDPWNSGGRLYRTGDLCRLRADGTIDFLGRIDRQVKLRGFRIELGEIEAALRACEGVRDAIAEVKGEGESRHIVGYVVGEADIEALKTSLIARLPGHMIPAAIVALDALPLLPSGKLNRAALPDPQLQPNDYVAPKTATENVICELFAEVLDLDRVSATDNFFALGGHSLLLLKFVALARQRDLPAFALEAIFAHPSPRELGSYLEHDDAELPSGIIPLNTSNRSEILFCFHPAFGLVGDYRPLAAGIDDLAAVYGVQCPLFSDPAWNPDDMTAVAEDYVSRIRHLQPYGPYRLLGWSLGGWIAAEVAYALERQGQATDFLGLVDTNVHIAHDYEGLSDEKLKLDMANLFAVLAEDGAQIDDLAVDQADLIRKVALVNDHLRYVRRAYGTSVVAADLRLWWAGIRDSADIPRKNWAPFTRATARSVATIETTHEEIVRNPAFIASVRSELIDNILGCDAVASFRDNGVRSHA